MLGFFGGGGSNKVNNSASDSWKSPEVLPTLKVETDKDVYRPGDSISVTIDVSNPATDGLCSLLIEKLGFEIKGIEKLDSQWFATQKPLPGSKNRRGKFVLSTVFHKTCLILLFSSFDFFFFRRTCFHGLLCSISSFQSDRLYWCHQNM